MFCAFLVRVSGGIQTTRKSRNLTSNKISLSPIRRLGVGSVALVVLFLKRRTNSWQMNNNKNSTLFAKLTTKRIMELGLTCL